MKPAYLSLASFSVPLLIIIAALFFIGLDKDQRLMVFMISVLFWAVAQRAKWLIIGE